MNRSKVLSLLGRFLTPLIILILLSIIFIGIFSTNEISTPTIFESPFVSGLLEGYQTFDAIGAVVIGGVLVISMNFNKNTSFQEKKELITKSGLIAGLGLFVIYAGLIFNGAIFSNTFEEEATRSEVLTSLSSQTLGNIGTAFLSVLVALACFTTAVGIITGTSDYFKGLFNNSEKVYTITAIIGCVLGVAIGQFDVHYIVNIALPALMFIYPITIVLILLNLLPEKLATPTIFKAVVIVTFIFSVPDFLQSFVNKESLAGIHNIIPFSKDQLGWVLPALLTFGITSLLIKKEA